MTNEFRRGWLAGVAAAAKKIALRRKLAGLPENDVAVLRAMRPNPAPSWTMKQRRKRGA